MPPRLDPSDPTPLDYMKYVFGILAALLIVPAFLQGALAFVQTFVQTLLSIVLTLNLLLLSAVTGAVGIWWWQRRAVAGSPPSASVSATNAPRLDRPAPVQPATALLEAKPEPETIEAAALADGALADVTLAEIEASVACEVNEIGEASKFGLELANRDRPPMIQTQLARRLGVSPSTVRTHKLRSDFGQWSRQKDPEQLAWRYCEEARQFFVVSA
ncbi:MAG: hypothetical protein ACFB9N_18195 [Geitlerinemataceae cyanobacterium]